MNAQLAQKGKVSSAAVLSPRQEDQHCNWELNNDRSCEKQRREARAYPSHQPHGEPKANNLSAQPSSQFTHLHQMSCIHLEITSGPACDMMNSQTAGNRATVFSAILSAALCLFIRYCFSFCLATAPPDMANKATGALNVYRQPPSSPCFICRPVAHSRTVAKKSHLAHSMAAVSGHADVLHAPRLPALPLGYSGNHG